MMGQDGVSHTNFYLRLLKVINGEKVNRSDSNLIHGRVIGPEGTLKR